MTVLDTYDMRLRQLAEAGNLRALPEVASDAMVDLTGNDYLAIAADTDSYREFLREYTTAEAVCGSSSASRLLAQRQQAFSALEDTLAQAYGHGRQALVFNSGYHANIGMVSALADKNTLILADRLVHASIIDGITLSRAPFRRFRHNDMEHLRGLIESEGAGFSRVLVIVESVYSMDGDCADLEALVSLKKDFPGLMLYVDEAHAVGVLGPAGLGMVQALADPSAVDVTVGTLGKALASVGAFAVVSPVLKQYFINTARSFIFSTALPDVTLHWSRRTFTRMLEMDTARAALRDIGERMQRILASSHAGHIQPLMAGSAEKAVALSDALRRSGIMVLPIRRPTVPPGTERLRFSLNASLTDADLNKVEAALSHITQMQS
ncbi:MAG: 8-amino-7-oxononanoate synthase [Muribaculaceae bacterium]|nr:8-amino-7-oxononanoate synthase [Muribaculaceae bacterium]